MWIRVPVRTTEPTAADEAVGISDWSTGGIDAEDSGICGEFELGPQRVVSVG